MPATRGTPDNHVDIAVVRTQDWREPLPTILDADTGLPRDITGLELRIYIRPMHGYASPIAVYSTLYGDIVFDAPTLGQSSIAISRADVIAALPTGEWRWFALLIDGAASEEVWRGRLTVYPGEVTWTPPAMLSFHRPRNSIHWLFLGGL